MVAPVVPSHTPSIAANAHGAVVLTQCTSCTACGCADPQGRPWFVFEPRNGTFWATRELDFEGSDPLSYFMDMVLLDNGTPPLNSTFKFEIRVINQVCGLMGP